MGVWLRPTRSCPALQNQEYEHPRDLAACCGSCRNVSCLFTFPNGTTSLFLVCSSHLPTREGAPELGPDGALGHTGLQSCALPVHSGHPSGRKSPHGPPLCPPARGVVDLRLRPPPLQQHSPGRCAGPLAHQLPTTQRDRVCQGQCQPLPCCVT